ncbi:hypothetical protein B1F79_02490 [Coxiella-like endosymbiont of Rhipicephalus sanguineus]|nr:hypothetical protein [Coxiella-like endosymbiont of Rhipicephalus sanguineus]
MKLSANSHSEYPDAISVKYKKTYLLYLILLISFPSVSAVLISRALSAISNFFHLSNGYTQKFIIIFVIGYVLRQLIYSLLLIGFGHKIVTHLRISLYLFSCLIFLIGIYVHSLEIVFWGRFLMALGSAV